MLRYSDSELEALAADLESDRVERKERWSGEAAERSREAVCSFANDLPDHRRPGVLFIGLKDDGSPSGLQVTDELLRTLADMKADGQILPPPTLLVEKRTTRGFEVAVVTVQPADGTPVRYRGRIWVRIGPRRGIATAQDERILNEKRKHRDLPFDVHPLPSCPLEALSRVLFEEEYLPQAFAPEILAANDRTYEQRLAACKLVSSVDSPVPTVLGLLVLGKSPRDWLPAAYVQFVRFRGTQWADPVTDELVIDGPVGHVVRRLDEKLEAHNQVGVDFTSQPTEIRSPHYPRAALQQIARNAIMHRAYESTHAPVRVYWFDDRVEFLSPGGPYGAVTSTNFGSPGITDYRNPHLAEAMKVLGLVQRFGVGIATARAELAKNGNPPLEFDVQPTTVLAVVRAKAAKSNARE